MQTRVSELTFLALLMEGDILPTYSIASDESGFEWHCVFSLYHSMGTLFLFQRAGIRYISFHGKYRSSVFEITMSSPDSFLLSVL